MGDPFKSTAKPYQGKMTPCRVCGKIPNEGDEVWMQNLGDETNKKWIISPHEECFKKLQENPELGKQERKFSSSKFPIGNAPNVYNMAEVLLEEFKKKRPDITLTPEQELQAIESFFKTLSGGFKL